MSASRLVHCVVALLAVFAVGCSDDDPTISVTEASFSCLTDLTPVRLFFVGNLLGDTDASIAVANGNAPPPFPAGTILQLLPNAAMVKREAGFNPEGNDWEFFDLTVTAEGTQIATRGNEAANILGDRCIDCHRVTPETDFLCETTNGCRPLPVGGDQIRQLQQDDPRCN